MNDLLPFSLQLSPEQKDLRDWAHEFARDVLRPAGPEWDEREEYPRPIVEEAARYGLYSWERMVELSSDPTGLSLPLVLEEIFWGDAGIGLSIFLPALAATAIATQGTADQAKEWLPLCYGTPDDIKLAAFCSSEPGAGSDVSAIKTRARFDEKTKEWVLEGEKAWAGNGGIADIHVVIATVDPELGSRGHAAFVVPPGAPGIRLNKKVKKHGLRASHTAFLDITDCRLPEDCLLGGREKLEARLELVRSGRSARSQAAMETFEATRPLVAAQAVGIARAAYEIALQYAKERQQFGRPIIENQSISFTLARMSTEIDAARLLTWRSSWMVRNGIPFQSAEGSMAKLKAGETAVWVTERAMQILGGIGYTREYPVERMHRDAKIYDIFEGTAEIQQLVIARAISGMHLH
jgi:acyl-CoA dehydrogenase